MFKKGFPHYKRIKIIVFDFDGVFTNNKVFVNKEGTEFVQCDRSDGLAFDFVRKFINKKLWDVKLLVLTREKNSVAKKKNKKLGLDCYFGVDDKKSYLLSKYSNYFDKKESVIKGLAYLGNDLNDLSSIEISEFSFSPSDSHKFVKKASDYVLNEKGGNGFVRAFFEKLLDFDNMNSMELNDLL